jgi:hypothetical protein
VTEAQTAVNPIDNLIGRPQRNLVSFIPKPLRQNLQAFSSSIDAAAVGITIRG